MSRYALLYTVTFTSIYFDDEKCRSLQATPSATCAKRLRGNKCVFKPNPYGFSVYYQTAEGSDAPFIEFDDAVEFDFELKLLEPEIFSYLDIDSAVMKTDVYRFTNTGTGDILEEGLDSITPEDRMNGIFGRISIADLETLTSETGFELVYELNIAPRLETWTYYIVIPEGVDPATYDLAITDADPDAATSPYGTLTFGGPTEVTVMGGRTAFRIQSSEDITYYQKVKPKLQLTDDGDVLVDNLPNPTASRPTSDMYIYV